MTPKQTAFAEKYVECGNASEAYRHAYDAENSSDTTVWTNASQLLSNTKVTLRVMELQEAEDAAETQPPKLACHH